MSANTPSEGSVSPASGWYNYSSVVKISAVPNQYYEFNGWSGTGSTSYSGSNPIYNITINSPITEQANFIAQPFILKFVESGLPSGQSWSVSLNNGNTNSSTTSTITFVETHGDYSYTPEVISVNSGERYNPSPPSGSVSLTSDTTENITYTTQYYLTMSANPSGDGTVSPSSGWYNSASSVSIDATPNSGYMFEDWSGSGTGSYSGTSETATITMDSQITETGNFAPAIMYVPITISNGQNTATASPFQQMIILDSANYASYEQSGLQNIEFTTGPAGSGTPLQAWIQSNASNTATHTIIWVNLTNGIGASSSTTIYLNFMPNDVMSSSGPTGEYPSATSSYGQYDNGPKVFLDYQNFAGTSTPSGWNAGTCSASESFSNGFTADGFQNGNTGGNTCAYVVSTKALNGNLPMVAEAYATSVTGPGNEGGGLYIAAFSTADSGLSGGGGGTPNGFYSGVGGAISQYSGSTFSTLWDNSDSYFGRGSYVDSPGIYESTNQPISFYYDGNAEATSSTSYTSTLYLMSGGSFYDGGDSNPASETIQWLLARAYPPNGDMPTVSFGSVE